jgi:hypothetical protein
MSHSCTEEGEMQLVLTIAWWCMTWVHSSFTECSVKGRFQTPSIPNILLQIPLFTQSSIFALSVSIPTKDWAEGTKFLT